MKQILAGQIFAGQSPDDLIRPAWVGALGFLVLGLVFAIPRDRARRSKKDEERRLKGPEMVTVGEFNRQSGADGISFLTTESKRSLSIPRSLESSHMTCLFTFPVRPGLFFCRGVLPSVSGPKLPVEVAGQTHLTMAGRYFQITNVHSGASYQSRKVKS